jgi:hypothetical protein
MPVFIELRLDILRSPSLYKRILIYGHGLLAPFTDEHNMRLLVDTGFWRQKPFSRDQDHRVRNCLVPSDSVAYFDTNWLRIADDAEVTIWNIINDQFDPLRPSSVLFDHPKEVIFNTDDQTFSFVEPQS